MNKIKLLTIIISFFALNKAFCMEIYERAIKPQVVNIQQKQNYFETLITQISVSVNIALEACEHIIKIQLKHDSKSKDQIIKQIKADVERSFKLANEHISAEQRRQLMDILDRLIKQKIEAILKKK